MSELIDAITTSITRRPAVNDESELIDVIRELVTAVGSAAGAARALGVAPTTFYRWRNYAEGRTAGVKQKPHVGRREMLAVARRASLSPAKERQIRAGEHPLKIDAQVVGKSDIVRPRKINFGGYFPSFVYGEILDHWLAGRDDLAEETLMEAIAEYYTQALQIEEINFAEFGP